MANEILKEELLSEDQLENVAGGTTREIVKDTDFMQAIGLLRQDETEKDDLRRAWAQGGVTLILHGGKENANEYYKNGKQISREAALKSVMKKTGSVLNINHFI
ncbi:MAG: hypothetical protein II902_02095 [Selenomonadaceae bacterium]|nr:hypothetical protein [Selenomonadaceae bacterium]